MDFSRRLVDNFFRHWFLFLLPVVVLGGLGVVSASQTTSEYRANGTLSASTNPLVEQPEIRGTEIGAFETPAQGTARLISEQLGTDAFVDTIAERAGLTEAIEAGLVTRDDIRSSVWTSVVGQNFFRVWASWDEPQTAFELVDATIQGYVEEVVEIAASDSREAIAFWERAEAEAIADLTTAEGELLDYLNSIEGVGDRTTDEELAVLRLNSNVEQAERQLDTARDSIARAQLAVEQAESEAGRLLRVVDPPQTPTFSESGLRTQVLAGGVFVILGILISVAALFISTALDRSVRSAAQLTGLTNVESVAAADYVKALRPSRRRIRRAA